MPHDLTKHADVLGDPADYFVEEDDRPVPLVVEHATGAAKFAVTPEGRLEPYDPAKHTGFRPGPVVVANPPDFKGFPDHDKADPRYDLAKHADVIGDPAAHFVHWEADRPLVVEHATGQPKFVFDGDKLKPV